jgi:hypothetical protein
MNIAWLIQMVNKYGSSLTEAWPYILHAWQDMQKAMVIFNDGKPLMLEGPLSDDAASLQAMLVEKGIDPNEARQVVAAAEAADGRV